MLIGLVSLEHDELRVFEELEESEMEESELEDDRWRDRSTRACPVVTEAAATWSDMACSGSYDTKIRFT